MAIYRIKSPLKDESTVGHCLNTIRNSSARSMHILFGQTQYACVRHDNTYSTAMLSLGQGRLQIIVWCHRCCRCYLSSVDRDSLADKTEPNLLRWKCKKGKARSYVGFRSIRHRDVHSVWEWAGCDYIQLFDGAGRSKVFAIPTRLTDRSAILCASLTQCLTEDCRRRQSAKFERREVTEREWPIFGLCTLDWNVGLNCLCMENESWENWNWAEKKANDNFDGRTQHEFTK